MERETVVIVVTTPEPESVAGEAPEKVKELVECGEMGVDEKKFSYVIDVQCGSEEEEKVCRICQLSSSDQAECQTSLIQLGCGCRGDLGIAHVHCGEAWFKLKGNRTCEICGEAATNITGIEDIQFIEEWNENRQIGPSIPEPSRAAGCWRGQSFCNFLMACLVIAFVLPWFFRISLV